jgi:lauroyl/myristoyl acyltransferase
MIGNYALYIALRLGSWAVPLVPLRLAYALASFAGRAAYHFFPWPRRALCSNLAHVLNSPADSKATKRTAVRVFQNDAKNWVDTLRIRRVSDAELTALVDVEGWQHLESALAGGHGAILVGMHLGNYDLVGQLVVLRRYPLSLPVERMHPERLFQFLMSLRTSKGINLIPPDRAPREMLRRLKAHEVVAIVGDRNIAGKGVHVEFFGATAVLPRGLVSLARHADAPVLIATAVRQPDDRFQGFITAPIPLVHTADSTADDRENAHRVASVMEGFIRRNPDQWLMFSSLWEGGKAPNQTATISQQKEAAV